QGATISRNWGARSFRNQGADCLGICTQLFLVFHFEHPIDEIVVIVEFDQCLLEQLDLHMEVHAGWAVKADQAPSGYSPLVPGLSFGPRKLTEFFVTNVQSPSFHPNDMAALAVTFFYCHFGQSRTEALIDQKLHPVFLRRGTRRSVMMTEPSGRSPKTRGRPRKGSVEFRLDRP
ncbi:hypothetical protein, partial [Sinorhizobium meliloti]|uniref:hypothetical protein n=1 Tax=Rhizobium meliloti TaxID=382 RepID=UPI00309A5246